MTAKKINLLGKSEVELKEFFVRIGEPSYRGTQLFSWIYQKRLTDFSGVTGFSKSLRARLSEAAEVRYPEIVGSQQSGFDGTKKMLLELEDGSKIETVLIPREKSPEAPGSLRETVCVSTQVGCPLDCKFCATGAMKFSRNLTPGEILAQILIAQMHATRRITNVVFMGMGEPLLNVDAVKHVIRILTDDRSMNIRAKGITVSTAGVPDKIRALGDEKIKFRLAFSLHSLNEDVRSLLMPINRKYPLARLIPEIKEFAHVKHDRVTFEYILFDGLNDTDEDIARLVRLSGQIPMKVNLLRFHPLTHLSNLGLQVDPAAIKLKVSSRIDDFADRLRDSGITVFIRSNSGEDIDGACGQLAARNKSG